MDPINREDARDAIVNVSHTCDGGHGEPCRQCEVLLKARDAVAALPSVPVATVQMGESELRHRLEWLAFKANSPTREDLQIEIEHILSRLKPVIEVKS